MSEDTNDIVEKAEVIPAAEIAKAVAAAKKLRARKAKASKDAALEDTAPATPDAKKKAKPAKKPAKKRVQKPKPSRGTARAKDRAKQQRALAKPLKRGPKGNPPAKVKRSGDATFGAKVARKRIYLGFTQAEMGKKVGILQPHMCNVEKGTLMPSKELRARINAVLFDKKTDPKALKHRRSTK